MTSPIPLDIRVQENLPVDTVVSNNLPYLGLETDSDQFYVRRSALYTAVVLDREKTSHYNLSLDFTPSHDQPILVLYVTVDDVNDHAPLFEPHEDSVDMENRNIGDVIISFKVCSRYETGMVGLVPKWVRLDPKMDKSGTFFRSDFSAFGAGAPTALKSDLKKAPDLSHLGTI